MRLSVYRGDNLSVKGIVRNQDGDIVNISGATIKFSVKKRETDTDYVIQKDCSITDAVNGMFDLSLSSIDTNKDIGTYYYDIELRTPAGTTHTIAKDNFVILRDITI